MSKTPSIPNTPETPVTDQPQTLAELQKQIDAGRTFMDLYHPKKPADTPPTNKSREGAGS